MEMGLLVKDSQKLWRRAWRAQFVICHSTPALGPKALHL